MLERFVPLFLFCGSLGEARFGLKLAFDREEQGLLALRLHFRMRLVYGKQPGVKIAGTGVIVASECKFSEVIERDAVAGVAGKHLLEFPAGGGLVVLIKVDVGLDNQSRG